jgi:hypothetical protein
MGLQTGLGPGRRTGLRPVRKDRVYKKYSLIGGFLKIVRQKGSKKFHLWKFSLQDWVERRDHSIGMVGLIRLFARMSKLPNVSLCEYRREGVELDPGCTRVDSLTVNAWVQARPCMRRPAPLAAFAESGISFDG